jgi:hypothetical protein
MDATITYDEVAALVGVNISTLEPPGSTKLEDETGHSCKMPHKLKHTFCTRVMGLPSDSWWAASRTEAAFKNLLLHDINAILYYFDTDIYGNCGPVF